MMDIDLLVSKLEDTHAYLLKSKSSDYSKMSVKEVIDRLSFEISVEKEIQLINRDLLGFLIAPTGPIQEISIDNGWGEDFLKLSATVDLFTKQI